MKQTTPHAYRRSSIKYTFILIALAAFLAAWLSGCSPRYAYQMKAPKCYYKVL